MAEKETTNPTLLDLATQTDPDGSIGDVVEILNEVSEILDDMTWQEGNMTSGNKSIIRATLPGATWRKMYGFVQPNKGETAQITDTTGMLEQFAEVDIALADLGGNAAKFRMNEDRAHIEGMHQELTETIFFGNETIEPEAFTGFSPRYNDLSAENADNIIDAGGTGSDNGSIWLIGWSTSTVFGIVPKGSTAGLQQEDLGKQTIQDNSGGRMRVYSTHFRWDAGLVVKDWRFVVRICNIDKSLLSTVYNNGAFATGANLPELMFQAAEYIPPGMSVRLAFYLSRDMRTKVRQQAAASAQNSVRTIKEAGGKRITEFDDIPLRRVDALSVDETRVV